MIQFLTTADPEALLLIALVAVGVVAMINTIMADLS